MAKAYIETSRCKKNFTKTVGKWLKFVGFFRVHSERPALQSHERAEFEQEREKFLVDTAPIRT
jgi:hypothetical protein